MKKSGINKIGGMKGGKGTKAKKAKVMKKRVGEKTMNKSIGKKTAMRGKQMLGAGKRKVAKDDMKIENFKDMVFRKFGGKT